MIKIELTTELELKLEILAEKRNQTIEQVILDIVKERILANEVRSEWGLSTGMVRFKEG